jgi:hypothetical protein
VYDRSAVNIDALTAELFAQPLDRFTSLRNARVKGLKASGRADLASQIAALKKPSVPLWVANQVAVSDADLLQSLRQSAQAVTRAQTNATAGRANAAKDLRAASDDFQRTLEAATSAAATALRRAQHATGDEVLRRIREIFRLAALQGGGAWDRLRKGALVSEPAPGDDVLAMFAPGGTPVKDKSAKRAAAQRAIAAAQKAAQADAERAEQAAAIARRLRRDATDASVAATRAAERASAADDEASRAAAQARASRRAMTRRRG